MRRGLALLLVTGCASAPFEARYAECVPPGAAEAARRLGYALDPPAPEGFGEPAAASFTAAPPWVVGQARVYPRDGTYPYDRLLPARPVRADTPLLCHVEFDRRARLGLFSNDLLTGADLSVVYQVQDRGPPLRAHGARHAAHVSLLDATTELRPDDVLRFAITERDVLVDDALATLVMPYGETLAVSTGVKWRGATSVRCQHLDPAAAEQTRADALRELDERLTGLRPGLEVEGWDFGLAAGGMTHMRDLLTRAASLSRWDDPPVHERMERLLGVQACFEQAAAPAVERRARWLEASTFGGVRWRATGFGCGAPSVPTGGQPDVWPEGPCILEVEATNLSDTATEVHYIRNATVVLAGGREVSVTLDGPGALGPGATAAVRLRLDASVAADVPLTRPVLLRSRRRRLLNREVVVRDGALWQG